MAFEGDGYLYETLCLVKIKVPLVSTKSKIINCMYLFMRYDTICRGSSTYWDS